MTDNEYANKSFLEWNKTDVRAWLTEEHKQETIGELFYNKDVDGRTLESIIEHNDSLSSKDRANLGLADTVTFLRIIGILSKLARPNNKTGVRPPSSRTDVNDQIHGVALNNMHASITSAMKLAFTTEEKRRKSNRVQRIEPEDPNDAYKLSLMIQGLATTINQAVGATICIDFTNGDLIIPPDDHDDEMFANIAEKQYKSAAAAHHIRQMTDIMIQSQPHGDNLQSKLLDSPRDGVKSWKILFNNIYVGMVPVNRYGTTLIKPWNSDEQSILPLIRGF